MTAALDPPRALVFGGRGRVGGLIARTLVPEYRVTVVDTSATPNSGFDPSVTWIRGDTTVPDTSCREAIERASVLVVALPEATALETLEATHACLSRGSLLVDTLSSKAGWLPRAAQLAEQRSIEVLSINPMFAPELGMEGGPVAAIPIRCGVEAERFLGTLESAGARIEHIQADDYAHLAAQLQTATHSAILSFGNALAQSRVSLPALVALSTPPHLVMLSLLARVVSNTGPSVCWDIQADTAHGAASRSAVRAGVERLESLVERRDFTGFCEFFADLRRQLEPFQDVLAEACAVSFTTLRSAMNESSALAKSSRNREKEHDTNE